MSILPDATKVIFHNGISDETYAGLLANDAIMVSASLAEGFGLPLAEALQLGVPAVVSDRSYFREIAGANGAVFADPPNPKLVADAVMHLDDSAVRQRYIAAGKFNITRLNWNTSAQALFETCLSLTSPR